MLVGMFRVHWSSQVTTFGGRSHNPCDCRHSNSRATCHRQSRCHNTNTSTRMQTTMIVTKVVLTSTCQATRPFQGCIGVQLVGNLVGVRSDVVQHALGGRQGGVASHHRAQLVDGRRGVVSTWRWRYLQRRGGAAARRDHVDGRGSAAGRKSISSSCLNWCQHCISAKK